MPKTKMTCQKSFCRERLAPKEKFDARSFRSKRLPGGKLLVFGCPVGKYKPRKEECSVGTRAQAILRPLTDKKCGACRVTRRRR